MLTEHHVKLTGAELGALWSSYMVESGSSPMLTYFVETTEDEEIKAVINKALQQSKKNLSELTNLFKEEGFPIPVGFSEEDVNLKAPKLYSDTFVLNFIRNLGKAGIETNGAAFSSAAREDIRKLYLSYLNAAATIEDEAKQLLLNKGIYIRPPFIEMPTEVTFVEKESFLRGWLGERRPLIADEIVHISMNYTNNVYGKTLLMGFSQTTKDEKLRKYYIRGMELARDILDTLSGLLEGSSLPVPMTWDSEISSSTVPPFSDKLMLFQATGLNAISLAHIGSSIAMSVRRDIAAKYVNQLKNVGLYAEDGIELMISYGWFERPPQALNRSELAMKK